MTEAELVYFVHSVDGARYGAWYRLVSPNQLEVIGVGMLEVAEFGGFSPESTARSVLENCVRMQKSMGIDMPNLDDDHEDDGDSSDDRIETRRVRQSYQTEDPPRLSRRG